MFFSNLKRSTNLNGWKNILTVLFISIVLSGCTDGRARDVTFLHISDQHYGGKNFDQNMPQGTIDAMNKIAGAQYPDKIGGKVGTPLGVILTGDLTDGGATEQFKLFTEDWGLKGGDGRLKFPVYEGVGNHDGGPSTGAGRRGNVRRQISERNKSRPSVVNTSENGLHYSWDWQDVHFVHLNEYAGLDDANRYEGNLKYKRKAQSYGNPSEKSLQFLAKDLEEKVGKSGRPVILCQHYGFDGFSFRPWGDERAWWTEEHALRLWETIEGYNIIALLSGHDGSEAVSNWHGITNYHMDDNIRFGVYHITDDKMTVSKRNSRTNTWEANQSQSVSINSSSATTLKAGPYLIYPNDPRKMTVCWRSDSNEPAEIAWGNVFFNYEGGKVSVEPYDTENHLYKYTISGLKPDTRYVYRVKYNDKFAPGMFYTAPDFNAVRVKFIVFGDTRNNVADFGKVNKAIYDKMYEDAAYHSIILHTGDWVGNGNNISEWDKQFFSREPAAKYARYVQSRVPIMGTIGNHDGNGVLYKKILPYNYEADRYYSFDYGPIHVSVLDEYKSYAPDSQQYKWLEKDLASTDKNWKFIVTHEPGWSAGSHPNHKEIQKFIQPLCESYGVDIFFAGHNHYYARAETEGVQHVTAGSGGAPMYDPNNNFPNLKKTAKTLHFCAVEVDGETLKFEAIDDSGKVIDSFTMQDNKGKQK